MQQVLQYLGALDKEQRITPLGRSMSAFPLLPRYAKMVILGQQFDNTPYIIAIVAGLSIGSPFLSIEELTMAAEASEAEINSTRNKFEASRREFSRLDDTCDVLRLLSAVGAYEYAGATDEFCQAKFLRIKAMREIRKLRLQITNLVNNQLAGIVSPVPSNLKLKPPSAVQIRTIKQVAAAAYLDHIAIRADLLDESSSKISQKEVLRTEYSPLIPPSSSSDADAVFIHPNSSLAKTVKAPEYIVYSELRESQTGRLRLIPLTAISAREIEPLAKGTPLIQYSKPLNYPPPRMFAENGVMKKEVYVVPRFGIQGRGWELPSVKRIDDLVKSY
jgi:ATP-dependent RNA helicase DHX37/DHR1